MIKSSKPRYQRRFRFNAPLHARQHFLNAHIDKGLRTKLRITRRSVQISTGDTVKVMSGSKKGTSGKVTTVSLRSGKITIDALKRKNARGKEAQIPINASNVYITDLNLSDKYRAAKLKVAVVPQKKEEKEPEAEANAVQAPSASQRHQAAEPRPKAADNVVQKL